MNPINNYISEKDLSLLDEFLNTEYEDAKPMNLTQAHGFVCGIVSSPNLIMPSQWLPILLGGSPDFGSREESGGIMRMILTLHSNLLRQMIFQDEFQFLLWENGERADINDCKDSTISDWCKGYLEALRLDESWFLEVETIELIFPFSVLANEFDIKGEKDLEGNIIHDDSELKKVFKNSLRHYVLENFDLWKEFREQNLPPAFDSTYRRQKPKIGRNDPCDCGSGKKYKKCCANKSPVTLH